MARLNRKKLIEEFEFLRQGFADALNFIVDSPAQTMSMKACHINANRCIVKLGGESVKPPKNNKKLKMDELCYCQYVKATKSQRFGPCKGCDYWAAHHLS